MRAGVYLLDQVPRQGLLADGLLSQGEPELTGLQTDILIWVLGSLEHVLGRREISYRNRRQYGREVWGHKNREREK